MCLPYTSRLHAKPPTVGVTELNINKNTPEEIALNSGVSLPEKGRSPSSQGRTDQGRLRQVQIRIGSSGLVNGTHVNLWLVRLNSATSLLPMMVDRCAIPVIGSSHM